jgi:rhodanese-related sulfurtransferase
MKKTKVGLLLGQHDAKLLMIAAVVCLSVAAACQSGSKSTFQPGLPPGSPELIQPEELLKALHSKTAKPAILYVGPRFLYAQAHIPGAEFVGAASEVESLDRLRKRVASLPKNSAIVLYCGCCPWEHCPNIRPAHNELQKMGFTNVKALYLANSFGTNWVDKGYPIEKENTGR